MTKGVPDLGSVEWLRTSGLGSWIESRTSIRVATRISPESASLVSTLKGAELLQEGLTQRLASLLAKQVRPEEFVFLVILVRKHLSVVEEVLSLLEKANVDPTLNTIVPEPERGTELTLPPKDNSSPSDSHSLKLDGTPCAWCDKPFNTSDAVISKGEEYFHVDCVRDKFDVERHLNEHYGSFDKAFEGGGWSG